MFISLIFNLSAFRESYLIDNIQNYFDINILARFLL